jgi:hypothetical protein
MTRRSVETRMGDLERQHDCPLEFISAVAVTGARLVEHALHDALAANALGHEWFEITEAAAEDIVARMAGLGAVVGPRETPHGGKTVAKAIRMEPGDKALVQDLAGSLGVSLSAAVVIMIRAYAAPAAAAAEEAGQ